MSDLHVTGVRVRAFDARDLPDRPRHPSVQTEDGPTLAGPTGALPDAREHAAEYGGPVGAVVIEIETDAGVTGMGTAGVPNAGTAAILQHHFAPILIGRDPFDIERVWETLYRSSLRFGGGGAVMAAIAAVDIALWDVVGKVLGVPVHQLLGGAVRPSVQVYASKLYATADLDQLADEARNYLGQGFRMMKQRFGYGPADGERGVRANVALIRTVREVVGDDVELAADAYMGWDLEYAIRMERELREFRLRWIEEPLLPWDIGGYVELRRRSRTAISHGEHSFTLADFRSILDAGAADFVQPDANRAGGITGMRRIFALGRAAGVPMVPHSNELHNLHLVFTHLDCPFAEYSPAEAALDRNSLFWALFRGNPLHENGRLLAPTAAGIGYELDEDVAERLEVRLEGIGR